MTIEAKVVGVRLWPRSSTTNRRVVSLEWQDVLTDTNPFPIHYTIDVDDPSKQFDLGDNVRIELTLSPQQDRTLSIQ